MSAKPWIIYTRVSTEDQAESGISLQAQENTGRAHCTARGLVSAEVITDAGFSGKSLDRPGVGRLIELIEAQAIDGFIVWRLDRVTRSLKDLLHLVDLCDRHGVAFVSITEQISTDTPMGRLMLHLLGSVAQWEREVIAERIRHGVRECMASGRWTGGYVPPGCMLVAESRGKRLVRDPATAPAVEPIWKMIADGATLADVAAYLTKSGIKPTRGMGWRKQTVYGLLSQKRLVGLLTDRLQFEAAAAAMKARACPLRGGEKHVILGRSERIWPLLQLGRCARCGAALSGLTARSKTGRYYPYLRCVNRSKRICDAPDLPAEAWERAVCEAVALVVAADGPLAERLAKHAEELRAQESTHREELAKRTKERDALKERVRRLIDLVESGDALGKDVGPRANELAKQAGAIELRIAELEGQLSAAAIGARGTDTIVAELRAGAAGLADAPLEIQRKTLHALVAEVRIASGKPMDLALWWPEMTKPGQKAGFVQRSQMVPEPGLEPG